LRGPICGEQNVSSDEKKNVIDSSSMHHGIWAKSGAEETEARNDCADEDQQRFN
jgi:hypothetical protein